MGTVCEAASQSNSRDGGDDYDDDEVGPLAAPQFTTASLPQQPHPHHSISNTRRLLDAKLADYCRVGGLLLLLLLLRPRRANMRGQWTSTTAATAAVHNFAVVGMAAVELWDGRAPLRSDWLVVITWPGRVSTLWLFQRG